MTTETSTHIFTVDDYHRMGEAGIFDEDDRVELIEGEIVDMPPIGDSHKSVVDCLNHLLVVALDRRAVIRVQSSVRLNNINEPEPDFAVLRWRDDFYARTTAGPGETLLLIDVADSSLARDRDLKAPLYGRMGIAEYWLVDVVGKTITVFRDPGPEGYRSVRVATGSQQVSPLAFPDLAITPEGIIL